MSSTISVNSPTSGVVVAILVAANQAVNAEQPLLVIEAMKMQTTLQVAQAGVVKNVLVCVGDDVVADQPLVELTAGALSPTAQSPLETTSIPVNNTSAVEQLRIEFEQRRALTLDDARQEQRSKRHDSGCRTARENLEDLCDNNSFIEYGQFAVAAQRLRGDYEQLKSKTAADGIITGTANINSGLIEKKTACTAVVINDYSVLAGTQGYYHHHKLDRILAVAQEQQLPVVMFTEGGGGRPGDTDITTVNSGLQCGSFAAWAKLSGVVPRISVANGYCFAGNAALFGSADITIATRQSWIGMAGPAMIEGGGLGQFAPTDIGPIEVQAANGVVDIVAEDEAHATELAKQCLSYFQGPLLTASHPYPDQQALRELLPSDRRYVYDIRAIINTLADEGSFIELKAGFGGAIVTGFIRLQGQPIGLLASDCRVLGGAIDVDAAEKAADFINLCNQFGIALVSLCDTPGFMVGPEHEQRGAARRLVKMFSAGAHLNVPLVAVVLRKCYGLGAQALLGGSTHSPYYTVAWPTGEFGPMGLEGAVKLGFKRELEATAEGEARQKLYQQLLASQYQRGQAIEVASLLEIDAVIDPADTRATLINALEL